MKREINVALIGYAFMGKAHSNAYRQVAPFFSPRLTPRLKVICGRNAANVERAARTFGWDESPGVLTSTRSMSLRRTT